MPTVKQTFQVEGMSCAACAVSVESTLTSVKGVKAAAVNYAMNTVQVEYDDRTAGFDTFRQALRAIGYDLAEDPARNAEKMQEQEQERLRKSRLKTFLSLYCFP